MKNFGNDKFNKDQNDFLFDSMIQDPILVNLQRATETLTFLSSDLALTESNIHSWHENILHMNVKIEEFIKQNNGRNNQNLQNLCKKFEDIRVKFDLILSKQYPHLRDQIRLKLAQASVSNEVRIKAVECSFFIYGQQIHDKEDRQTEFKNYQLSHFSNLKYRDIIKKTITSFLNQQGGTIFLGIRDYDITVQGVDLTRKDMDDMKLQLSNIRRQIEPECHNLINLDFIPIKMWGNYSQGKWIVRIKVSQGDLSTIYAYKSQEDDNFSFSSAFREDGSSSKYELSKFLSVSSQIHQVGRKRVENIVYAHPDINSHLNETNSVQYSYGHEEIDNHNNIPNKNKKNSNNNKIEQNIPAINNNNQYNNNSKNNNNLNNNNNNNNNNSNNVELKKENQKYLEQINQLRDQLQEIQQKIANKKTKIQKLKNEQLNLQSQCLKISEERNKQKTEIQNLVIQNNQQQLDLLTSNAKIDKLQQQCLQFQQQISYLSASAASHFSPSQNQLKKSDQAIQGQFNQNQINQPIKNIPQHQNESLSNKSQQLYQKSPQNQRENQQARNNQNQQQFYKQSSSQQHQGYEQYQIQQQKQSLQDQAAMQQFPKCQLKQQQQIYEYEIQQNRSRENQFNLKEEVNSQSHTNELGRFKQVREEKEEEEEEKQAIVQSKSQQEKQIPSYLDDQKLINQANSQFFWIMLVYGRIEDLNQDLPKLQQLMLEEKAKECTLQVNNEIRKAIIYSKIQLIIRKISTVCHSMDLNYIKMNLRFRDAVNGTQTQDSFFFTDLDEFKKSRQGKEKPVVVIDNFNNTNQPFNQLQSVFNFQKFRQISNTQYFFSTDDEVLMQLTEEKISSFKFIKDKSIGFVAGKDITIISKEKNFGKIKSFINELEIFKEINMIMESEDKLTLKFMSSGDSVIAYIRILEARNVLFSFDNIKLEVLLQIPITVD